MSRVASALVESKLASLVADAPLLSADADALLSDAELPALAAVCSALGVPLAHSADPPDGLSLPMRLITGGVDAERTLWRTFAETALHEVLTRELIDALVSHLSLALDRCERAGVATPTILEVGAGNGMLAHHLTRRLEGRARVVAVDDGSSRIARQAEVHVLDQATALARFRPQIVLACWMPSGCDWTAGFRACASVREYLLLGRPSACGDERASMPKGPRAGSASLSLSLSLWLVCLAVHRWRPCQVPRLASQVGDVGPAHGAQLRLWAEREQRAPTRDGGLGERPTRPRLAAAALPARQHGGPRLFRDRRVCTARVARAGVRVVAPSMLKAVRTAL